MANRTTQLLTTDVAGGSRGRWNRVRLTGGEPGEDVIFLVRFHDGRGDALMDYLSLRAVGPRRRGVRELVCFIPPDAVEARLHAVGATSPARNPVLTVQPLGRALASALFLLRGRRGTLARLVRAAVPRRGLRKRLRSSLATIAYEAQVPRHDYRTWIALFDGWSEEDLAPDPASPSIGYLVFARERSSEALAATLGSLAGQRGGPVPVVIHHATASPPDLVAHLGTDYVGVLQAGEVLPSHATALAARQLQRLGRPRIAIADEDEITLAGTRHSPSFKPTPNDALMLSGTLARGLWLVRAAVAVAVPPGAPSGAPPGDWAEGWRLSLWFGDGARAAPAVARLPYILSHRRPDAEAAPAETLAAVVGRRLRGGGPAITPIATWPLTFALRDRRGRGRVTAIVPSTLRRPHSLSCIRAVVEGTDHPLLDLHVTVMQPGPLDAEQRAAAEALGRLPNVTVTWTEAPRFNFSAANNIVARRTEGDHILLLNDDVSPIRADWLRWMLAFLDDERVGIVGARLLYPDDRVQHGGVIMGLSGLCDHAFRYLPAGEPGYMSRAVLAGELSAVTAACMLVRRRLFDRVGGLDERYPSAFNDVDFALRVGETGHSVLYVPQATLHHHELQTYGSHYAGERQPFQAEETVRLRSRWAAVCADDPFHNPNLALVPGFEWDPVFPPRTGAGSE